MSVVCVCVCVFVCVSVGSLSAKFHQIQLVANLHVTYPQKSAVLSTDL